MRQEADRLEKAQAHALVIFPMEPTGLRGWFEDVGPRIKLAGDPRREVLSRYGVGRLPLRRVVNARALRESLQALRHTELRARQGGDMLGQPALFVIDRDRRVRFAHFGSEMIDRPAWEHVFSVLSKCSADEERL